MIFSVGIDNYPAESGFAPLRYARRDAMLFSIGLFSEAVRVDHFEEELTRADFISKLRSFLSQCEDGHHIIYFAGHSFVSNKGTHLALLDTKKGVEADTSVAVNDILRWTAHARGQFLIVLDSCRNETDDHEFDYYSRNSAILYSTSAGSYRYENFSVSQSFPATLERSLRYLGETFSLEELRDRINSEEIGFRQGNNAAAECASNPWLGQAIFSVDRAVFEVTEITTIELFTSPGSGRTLGEFESDSESYFDTLRQRFSGIITVKPLDKVDHRFFYLEVSAPKQFLSNLLNSILGVFGAEFSGISLMSPVDFEKLSEEGKVTKLPGSVPNGSFFMWNTGQYLVRTSGNTQKIIPVEGNEEIGLQNGNQVVAMCVSLNIFS